MKWVPIKARLPEEGKWVLLWRGCVEMGIYESNVIDPCFSDPDRNYLKLDNVTHWMPLPALPSSHSEHSETEP